MFREPLDYGAYFLAEGLGGGGGGSAKAGTSLSLGLSASLLAPFRGPPGTLVEKYPSRDWLPMRDDGSG